MSENKKKETRETMVFRVEKNADFTVMSNLHFRNNNLSLKAKGLLSEILTLPDDWDRTLAGLARINSESVDAIRTAVRELGREGYIVREQKRDGCKFGGAEYVVREYPETPSAEDDGEAR